MTTPTIQCPQCAGWPIAGHPAGYLECHHAADCGLLVAEDATRNADFERGQGAFTRPATATELALMEAFGLRGPVGRQIDVAYLTNSVRRRTWTAA